MTNRLSDRHTDRQRYSICGSRPHLAIDAMRPKNHSLSDICQLHVVKFWGFGSMRCYDPVGWVTGRAYGPLVTYATFLGAHFWNQWTEWRMKVRGIQLTLENNR